MAAPHDELVVGGDVSLFDDLAGLLAPSALRRQQAVAALQRWVRRRADAPVATRQGGLVRIEARDRDDVAQDVLLRIVRDPGRIVEVAERRAAEPGAALPRGPTERGGPEALEDARSRVAAAYFERMLAHRAVDLARTRGRREVPLEPVAYGLAAPPTAAAEGDLAGAALAALREVTDHVLASTPNEEHRRLRALAWRELTELAAGTLTMDEVLAREVAEAGDEPGPGPDPHKRARDRVLQRHSRLRRYLLEAVDALAERPAGEGGLGVDRANLARIACREILVRCQRTRSGPSERRVP